MSARIAGLVVVAMIAGQRLKAAQVNFTNLLPPGAVVNFVKTDAAGYIYVTGTVQALFGGVFVAKISSDGTTLIYNTSIGGSPIGGQFVGVSALAASPDGSAYVVNFFTAQIGGSYFTITKLDLSGNVLFSAPGGSANPSSVLADFIQDMSTDADGNVYATGTFGSISSSAGALSNPQGTGFICKLDPNLNTIWSIAGYGGRYIAVDLNGNAYVAGATAVSVPVTSNAFQTSPAAFDPASSVCGYSTNSTPVQNLPCAHQYVTAVDTSGVKLIYSTYLSGTFNDVPAGIAVDSTGTVYVAGSTHSFDFPTTPGVIQETYPAQAPNFQFPTSYSIFNSVAYPNAFTPVSATGYIAGLNPSGTALVFSTFFGGSATDLITAMALDPVHQTIDVAGSATSPDLPGVDGAYRQCVPQFFIARLTLDGAAAQRTVLVPALAAFTPAANGAAFFAGAAGLSGYVSGTYTLSGIIDFDAPDSPIACLANSLDLSITTVVTPGQLLTVFGNQLCASTFSVAPSNNGFPTSSSGVQIKVDGVPAPLLYVSPGQINLQVPFEVAVQSQVSLQLTATNSEDFPVSDSRTVSSISASPTVLQVADAPGDCPGSYLGQTETYVINADGSRNSCTNPAKLNSTVTIFVGGLGTATGESSTGSLSRSAPSPLALPVAIVSAYSTPGPTFVSAEPFPGTISGLYRIQLQLPASAQNGIVQAGLQVNGYTAENVITIPVTQ